ncbi:MAG: carboxypeptidase regulatory-like domain-containing protein [Blastocatellia bacterium]
MSKTIFAVSVLVMALMMSAVAFAQSASVAGTITDKNGAVIAGAEVELTDTATNQARKVVTSTEGNYALPSVPPGTYKVTVKQKGFRSTQIPSFKVDIAKAYTLDLSLEVGNVGETVDIVAGAALELQKLDATVGNVVDNKTLKELPNLSRDTTALMLFQPMVAPSISGDSAGGQVAGARSDQNTFMLDGGDATSNTEGNGGYNSGFTAVPRAVVPTPAESIQEFRVSTNNAGASFGRSAGAQVAMETKRGTNALHGSAYWYHQNDNLNANTWIRNRTRIKDPELKDNRFGFSLGGPIIKDKTFIFGHYEGRRFPRFGDALRLVPTASLKQGILRFRDAANNIVGYDLKTSTACAGGQCDPRGLGISPSVKAVWDLLPNGNDPSSGDGLNFIGYRVPVSIPLREDFAVARVDHQFTEKWQWSSTYRYGRTREPVLSQIDITGGKNQSVASSPLDPRYVSTRLTGQLSNTVVNEFNFNYLRHFWEWARFTPKSQVSSANAALAIAGEGLNSFVDEPINVDTQNARSRAWNGRDFNIQDNLSWAKGNHSLQFGGKYLHQSFFHQRDDKVVGGLTALVYQIEDGQFAIIGNNHRPVTCGAGVTANCIQAGDVNTWNKLYAATLGMMDRATQLFTRNGSLQPEPPGTPLKENVTVKAYELYGSDSWRLSPSLTVSYGLAWNVQQPPTERQQKQTLLLADGQVISSAEFLAARQSAAVVGRAYNPELSVSNVNTLGRKYPYDPDYNNVSPRFAIAWNPNITNGLAGKFFGGNKTVLRGGYSLAYDRVNGVGIVMIPILGIGYGQLGSCRGPVRQANGTVNCTAAVTDPTNAFRIGVDGNGVPVLPSAAPTLPLVPGKKDPFELLSFQIDARRKVGRNHSADFTIQRELPGKMIVEVGYVGRYSRGLYQGLDLNQVPFFMKSASSNQTFAQAYDAVATSLRAGQTPATQPWFEEMLKGSAFCPSGTTCTAELARRFGAQFTLGQVYTIFANINNSLVTGPVLSRNQVEVLYMITDFGRSNYNAGFVSLQKRASNGLNFAINYTISQSLDQKGFNQSSLNSATNAYDLNFDYGPSLFDRRHIFNSYFGYELPFGQGKKFSSGKVLDKVIGGWRVAGIFTTASGLPLEFVQGTGQEFGQANLFGSAVGMIQNRGGLFSATRSDGVLGSNNIGTNAGGAGSRLNAFADPEAVYNSFRRVLLSQDTRVGRGVLRGLPRWNVDLSLAKTTQLTEKVIMGFSADFTNAFNRVEFGDPTLNFTNPRAFGVLNSQINLPRYIQLGLRFEW